MVLCRKRNTKVVALLTVAMFLVYMLFNVLHQVVSGPGAPKPSSLLTLPASLVKTALSDKLPVSLKDIIPQPDGNVDVVLSINVADLFKIVDQSVFGNSNGEATMNALPSDFSVTMHNPSICRDNPNMKWIIYVHSAPANIERRNWLRTTWGNKDLFKDKRTGIVFLVGTPTNPKEQRIINDEQQINGDLVQSSFTENYKNLTYKAILGLKWASEYCPNVPYALKADDDAFINIFMLEDILQKQKKKEHLIICPLWKENSMPILRDPQKCMKWCVKYSEFPGKKYFPKYCAGLGYLMSMDMLPKMYEASKSTPFFWIDDVYTTGLLAGKVKDVTYVDLLKNFTLKEPVTIDDYTKSNNSPTIIFAHIKKKDSFYAIWNATLHKLPLETLKTLSLDSLKNFPDLLAKVS